METKKLTVYNTYIEVQSEKQYERLLVACESAGLKTYKGSFHGDWKYFRRHEGEFWCLDSHKNLIQVSENKWLELLKTFKKPIS